MRSAFLLLFCSVLFTCFGQDDSVRVFQKPEPVIGVKIHYGTIYVHTSSVQNVAGARPYGVEVDIATQRKDQATYQLSGAYPRAGISVSYFNFDSRILGHSASVSYFLEPVYRLSDFWQLQLRGSVGITYLSNPYDPEKSPDNKSYSQYLNPYLQLGIGLGYRINKQFSLALLANFQHVSNGGYTEPNRGVNWVTGSVGIWHNVNTSFLPKYQRVQNKFWKGKPVWVELGLMFVPQQGNSSKLNAQRKFMVGALVQVSKQIGATNAITAGTEIYYNKFERSVPDPPNENASPYFAGIHAGHAFLFGKVIFSQQIGWYVFNQTNYFSNYYHRWGLTYQIQKHWLIGANLKAHSDNADFFDMRVLYKF